MKVFHKPNGGISDARNFGLRRACGEYVAFIDADDLLHPDFAGLMLQAASERDADIVFGGVDFFRGSFRRRKIPGEVKATLHGKEEVLEKALYQTGFDNTVCGKVYRRSLWEGLEFSAGRRYEDLDIFYKPVSRAAVIEYIDLPLYGYRQHSGSYIHTFDLRRADALDVTDEMLEWFAGNMPHLLPAVRDRRMSAHFNIILLLYANRAESPEIERRCLEVIKSQRRESLLNGKVRIKNRLGALVSIIGGRRLLRRLSFIARN